MTPEEIIAAFLNIWETNPNNVFEKSGAVKGLDRLKEVVTHSQSDSNEVFVDRLGQWCGDYPQLTTVVMAAKERKFKPENNFSSQEVEQTLANRYPQISQALRDRQPNADEDKPK